MAISQSVRSLANRSSFDIFSRISLCSHSGIVKSRDATFNVVCISVPLNDH